ncbi:predicted protein [Histoplasma capsulatum var. duboisii H88]|uniref:Predicted protein n=1 Tax=Ajellomyces capsulatus (strain H88) TaxID=544711 RepID=F0U715_AJEC8|nr:predicted protein [Histoplasma capsulatum var. duboisii H88]
MEIKGEEEEEGEGEGESHNDTESCSRLLCLYVYDQPDAVRRMEQSVEQSVRLSCEGELWRGQQEARQVSHRASDEIGRLANDEGSSSGEGEDRCGGASRQHSSSTNSSPLISFGGIRICRYLNQPTY